MSLKFIKIQKGKQDLMNEHMGDIEDLECVKEYLT